MAFAHAQQVRSGGNSDVLGNELAQFVNMVSM